MSSWLCLDCGWIFLWVRQGLETKPERCLNCGGTSIDAIEE